MVESGGARTALAGQILSLMLNREFQTSLRRRRMNHARLAESIGVTRSVLTRVLASKPGQLGRGKETRPKLFPLLTRHEIVLLGWLDEYLAWLNRQWLVGQVVNCAVIKSEKGGDGHARNHSMGLAGYNPTVDQPRNFAGSGRGVTPCSTGNINVPSHGGINE